jgi:hypothetical protein
LGGARIDPAMVKLLVGAGANVSAANRYGVKPLSLACEPAMRRSSICCCVGAIRIRPVRKGNAADDRARRAGSARERELLIARGAAVKPRKHGAARPRSCGRGKRIRGGRAIVDRHGADIHARSNGGFTRCCLRSREGSWTRTRTLLDAGARANESLLPRCRRTARRY